MNSPKRSQITLRLNKDLDERIALLSNKIGVSKNAYILMVLARELDVKNEQTSTSA
ncbi:toxin-antitoxin system HicB family antitoxin [Effusibacillus dendaii]|uniref:Toxin-antitoxin system HicB family antitoxin n=1 Tax=Effusibacillus dendaii TaxID=2743772 RepID=A0A7I8D8M9_9BACL|nr:toxin-antitoxin system HicB family antitoxin [Effusibacillus dendaii]BCJ86503.1 hypothetical protein skT53_14880 [Effusibacillus dendaii]